MTRRSIFLDIHIRNAKFTDVTSHSLSSLIRFHGPLFRFVIHSLIIALRLEMRPVVPLRGNGRGVRELHRHLCTVYNGRRSDNEMFVTPRISLGRRPGLLLG